MNYFGYNQLNIIKIDFFGINKWSCELTLYVHVNCFMGIGVD
jgi:hypothetical protein